jgi:sec-independent protein translocase protein TatA
MVPGGWELVLVLVVVLLLFGAKRLPDSARALGRSMRILKAETKGLREDETPASTTTVTDASVQAHPLPPVQPVTPPAPEQPHQRSA